jgi:hypothetical protein
MAGLLGNAKSAFKSAVGDEGWTSAKTAVKAAQSASTCATQAIAAKGEEATVSVLADVKRFQK